MKVDDSVPQPFSQFAVRSTTEPTPTLPLMHFAHVLAGLATLLLGPILPLLAQQWHLTDSQSGLLPLAQFCGATLGGVTVSSRLARGLLIGVAAAAIGFFAFAFAPGLPSACVALLLGGFGVGRSIASINIIGGARYTDNRGAALSRLNFSWSFGALLSPLLAALLVPHFALRTLIICFAALFLVCGMYLALQIGRSPDERLPVLRTETPADSFPLQIFFYFAALLFVYGGLETCLNVWLTTYAQRYGQSSLMLSQYTLVLLLCGLTAGRAISAWLLLRMRDSTLQRIALATSAALAAALATAHTASLIATLAVLLGVALAPIFPATFALLMSRQPPSRQAGIILAASGLGAASLPSLMGVLSTHTGSLQVALILPISAALLMLLLSSVPPATTSART
jgi:FHS family glucose/mannose:H+ symporter-like MFS transporter